MNGLGTRCSLFSRIFLFVFFRLYLDKKSSKFRQFFIPTILTPPPGQKYRSDDVGRARGLEDVLLGVRRNRYLREYRPTKSIWHRGFHVTLTICQCAQFVSFSIQLCWRATARRGVVRCLKRKKNNSLTLHRENAVIFRRKFDGLWLELRVIPDNCRK